MGCSSNSSTSSSSSLDQQLISQAQNDLSIANTIILYTGLFLAILTVIAAGLASFGVIEFRRIGALRRELMEREHQIIALERQVEQQTVEQRQFEQTIVREMQSSEERLANVLEERQRKQIEEQSQSKIMLETSKEVNSAYSLT